MANTVWIRVARSGAEWEMPTEKAAELVRPYPNEYTIFAPETASEPTEPPADPAEKAIHLQEVAGTPATDGQPVASDADPASQQPASDAASEPTEPAQQPAEQSPATAKKKAK